MCFLPSELLKQDLVHRLLSNSSFSNLTYCCKQLLEKDYGRTDKTNLMDLNRFFSAKHWRKATQKS